MEWTDSAMVLSLGTFREADVWLNLLTVRHGLVHVFAFGGKRSRKRFPGCLDILNFLRLRVSSGKNNQFLNLQEATLTKAPRNLRTNNLRFGMMINCIRFLESLNIPQENSKSVFSLIASIMDMLEGSLTIPETLPILFRLRLASEQGYVPAFHCCTSCGKPLIDPTQHFAYWDIAGGTVQCRECAEQKGGIKRQRINTSMLTLLNSVQHHAPHDWLHCLPAPNDEQICTRLIDDFVQYHLGIVWNHGRFYKT